MASGKHRHSEPLDIAGMRFGALTVLRLAPKVNASVRWECECVCGTRLVVTQMRLVEGVTTHCGCGGRAPEPEPAPDPTEEMARYEREFTSATPTLRKCHDCGAATPDYRCARCRDKWRAKHHVRPSDVEQGDIY